jgi:hypothetical protein
MTKESGAASVTSNDAPSSLSVRTSSPTQHTPGPWEVSWLRQGYGEILVIHGPPEGDMDTDTGRTIDCTQYIADMRDTPRDEIDAAHIVKCVNGYERIVAAARALYYAAHWTPDRECDAGALWTELRDACEFEPGHSPKPAVSAPEARGEAQATAERSGDNSEVTP